MFSVIIQQSIPSSVELSYALPALNRDHYFNQGVLGNTTFNNNNEYESLIRASVATGTLPLTNKSLVDGVQIAVGTGTVPSLAQLAHFKADLKPWNPPSTMSGWPWVIKATANNHYTAIVPATEAQTTCTDLRKTHISDTHLTYTLSNLSNLEFRR